MAELVDILRDYEQVTRVIRTFEAGGRITSMMVSVIMRQDPDDFDPDAVSLATLGGNIDTRDMDYPPQMVELIKANLKQRQKKIADELAALGVIVPTE